MTSIPLLPKPSQIRPFGISKTAATSATDIPSLRLDAPNIVDTVVCAAL
jgi:hypothetical protein